MTVKYRMISKRVGLKGNKTFWFAHAVPSGEIDLAGLARHMSHHNTPYSEGQIMGVLQDFVQCFSEALQDGSKVKATADIQLGSLLVIRGVKLVRVDSGRLVVYMPSYPEGKKYFAAVEIKDLNVLAEIETLILGAYPKLAQGNRKEKSK